MAAQPSISTLNRWANPPSDLETLEQWQPNPGTVAATADQLVWHHPFTQYLLRDPIYNASRPHLKIPAEMRAQNLTGGTLVGEDMIPSPPLTFVTDDGSELVSFTYVGPSLCGHPGIVHGGLLATLLDEGLARCCFPALPNKVGVTASLKIDYRAPTKAGQVVVLRAWTTKVEGRKAWVKGRLETLSDPDKWTEAWESGEFAQRGGVGKDGGAVVLVEAEALFVEPKGAANMPKLYAPTGDGSRVKVTADGHVHGTVDSTGSGSK
ncbi:Thioesterase/thiol ester dehydrase-isomerase [Patellaria atrata CBS 101060]|uniref:Thioesterase/thiol ester dehydrase-isomerase n=1 Tax=Patellaria atrata CBS 101060 TaxID=1346257 RepID=A0A9P4SHE1_9PEZI|nr:Thioesterase/thiol ester dehydrase-isomerase [Patellaria atrata CBS 101060]